MKPIRCNDLLGAFSDFKRSWPQMLLTDLLSRALAVTVLVPVVGLLLKVFLTQADDGVLADADIALFLLHPTGLAALMAIGTVSLGILFAEQCVLMVIAFGAAEGRRVTWTDAFRYVGRYLLELVELAGHALARLLLICAPFVAAIAGVYLLLLSEHDINFYLAQKPPAWWYAISMAGLITAALVIVLLKIFAGWILCLPLVLFGRKRGRGALRTSVAKTAMQRWKIVFLLALWAAGFALASAAVTFLAVLPADLLIPDSNDNLTMVVLSVGATLLLAGIGNLGLAVVATMLFAAFNVRLYRLLAGPGRFDSRFASREVLGASTTAGISGKVVLGIAAAALIVMSIAGYLGAKNMDDADREVAIIAHRGASASAPENTLAAFERAIAEGADWIELDVQENGDGIVVVAHDSDFMKVARNDLKVRDATDEDLRELDIGSWYAPEYAAQRVPTLRQALELARGKLGVVIELKYYGHDRELESRVVDVVEQTAMAADVMIMSLKLAGLHKVTALRPNWSRGLLNTASIGDLTRLDLDFLALNSVSATRAMILRAHKKGIKTYVWTINDPIQMSVMVSRGADGIITDEPALARQVMALRQKLSPIERLIIWIAGETGLLRDGDGASAAQDA